MSTFRNAMKKPISPVYLIAAVILSSVSSIAIVRKFGITEQPAELKTSGALPAEATQYKFSKPEGYKFVHPLYLAEPTLESKRFDACRLRLESTIQQAIAQKELSAASVYLKDFKDDEWMCLRPTEKYLPGSLFKVVTLIAYFRMAADKPALWSEKWPISQYVVPPSVFGTRTTRVGTLYSVPELMQHMIVNNDDNAALVLHQHIDKNVFNQIFADMHLPTPVGIPDTTYRTSAQEYSRFVSAVYESGYLPLPASEAAIALLSQTTFKEGIVAGLPAGIVVAHKYGEVSSPNATELHETAIIYRNGTPYLLTIMTRGQDMKKQAQLIAKLSELTWEEMNRNN